MVWQGLGILFVSLGSTAVLLSPHSASMVAMTVLPLSPDVRCPIVSDLSHSLHCPGTGGRRLPATHVK
jgi:hypothetical protein